MKYKSTREIDSDAQQKTEQDIRDLTMDTLGLRRIQPLFKDQVVFNSMYVHSYLCPDCGITTEFPTFNKNHKVNVKCHGFCKSKENG